MTTIKNLIISSHTKIHSWRVFVEEENKFFLMKLFPEKGIQGYLYNLFIQKLREEFLRQDIQNYRDRLKKLGSFKNFAENLEITIKTRQL